MKRSVIFILLMGFVCAGMSYGQDIKNKDVKAMRGARKEAKQFEKDGYYVAPGALPMDKQLEQAWAKQLETDDMGFPMYITAEATSLGETQIAAQMQALEVAKTNLAGQIATTVGALIETNVANQQLNADEAASVTKTVAGAKNLIAQEIGRTITLFKIYKKSGKNIECNVRIAYNQEMALEQAKKVIRQQLEEETELVQAKLDKLMDFE
ncbi:MAG: hypothetical protein ACOC10_00185 [Bacteroidota bacterium]